MARPQKNGIEYFSIDVVLDEKIELIEAKYGIGGLGIIIKLWQKIYANSYYIEWSEDILLLFKKAVNVDINLINDIINDCLRWQIFNENLYKTYGILTSQGIQKRYIEATQRRKEVNFIKEYLLIENVMEKYQKTVNVHINAINVDINSKKDNSGTQSKVKESKVNTSTNVDVSGNRSTRFQKPDLEEVEAYCAERGNKVDATRFIDYYESKGWLIGKSAMKDWRAAVRTWERSKNKTARTEESVLDRIARL